MQKKYSYLWNFFLISDADACKALCYLCNQTLSYKTTITNLKKHLVKRHPEIQIQPGSVIIREDVAEMLSKNTESIIQNETLKTVQNEIVKVSEKRPHESTSDSSVVKLKKVEQDYVFPRKMNNEAKKCIDHHLLTMFTKDLHKFSLVEDSGFKAFVKALNPQYDIPDLWNIVNTMLPELYDKIKQQVEDALQDGLSITLTIDSWTSAYHDQLISVKAHFLDQNFEAMSVLLDCYSFSEQPTNEKLNDVLRNVVNEWGINDKIILVVSNAVYEQTTEEQLQWEYINCVVHTINIIAASSLELVSNLLLKVQCIVSCYKQNKHATTQLLHNQECLGSAPQDLILSDTTDWYSVFTMLRRFVDLEDFIKITLCLLDVSLTFLTKEEWSICREIVEIIKPFETFIKSLSEEKYVSSSLAIILSKGLETMLKELSQKNFHSITHSVLSKCIQETIDQFSSLYSNNILLISTFLDPRFKDVIFEPSVRQELKMSIVNIVSTNLHSHKELCTPKLEGGSSSSSSNEESLSIWKAFQSKASEFRPSGKKDSRASIEIQQYLDDGLLPRSENPMQWWKINGHMYPHLKNLMKQNLAVTCSSISCGHFSKSSQILRERRTHLSVEEAKLILFINSNDYLLRIND